MGAKKFYGKERKRETNGKGENGKGPGKDRLSVMYCSMPFYGNPGRGENAGTGPEYIAWDAGGK